MTFKTLNLLESETSENRLIPILEFIYKFYQNVYIHISSVDSTGFLGNKLTKQLNKVDSILISQNELFELMNEKGQLIEGVFEIQSKQGNIRLKVSDGLYIDIFENGIWLPDNILGPYVLVEDN